MTRPRQTCGIACLKLSSSRWRKPRLHTSQKPEVSIYTLSSEFSNLSEGFNCTNEEDSASLTIIRKRAWEALRSKIDEQTTDPVILGKLRSHFEERFRYDEHGVPRVWKPDDDIDGAFKKAKDQVLQCCLTLSVADFLIDTRVDTDLLQNRTSRFIPRVHVALRFLGFFY